MYARHKHALYQRDVFLASQLERKDVSTAARTAQRALSLVTVVSLL